MELWIRSQDKKILTKVDSLILTNTGDIKLGNDIDTGITLASYCPYYQRALEILDEIQNILKPKMIIESNGGAFTSDDNNLHIIKPTYQEIKQLDTIVYEMPKE